MLIDIHVHTCRPVPLAVALGKHFVTPEELIAMMLRKNRDLRPPDLSFVQKQLHDISVYRTPRETKE